jgi:predicted DNA-binding protein (MmcQ/YjbR family)
MILADFCAHCLSMPAVEETTPFGPDVLVYKVCGKMFALAIPDEMPHRVNLKCDPERALELRDRYEDIMPGYHMNKRHWNTLQLGGGLPNALVRELIEHSYALVVASLPKKMRVGLEKKKLKPK